MNIFQLAFSGTNEAAISTVETQLNSAFEPDNIYNAGSGVFFIAHPSLQLPKEIAEKLGENVTGGSLGNFVVTPVTAYWGYHKQALWGWLTAKGL